MRRAIIIFGLLVSAAFLIGARWVNNVVELELGSAAALGQVGLITSVNKFGFNADVDATEESIWDADDLPTSGDGPLRCFANIGTTAAALYVSSDDATDAAKGITIEVITSTWGKKVITMALGAASAGTGTAFVQVGSETLLRVNRAYATSTAFAGNIYVHKDAADAAVQDGIPDTVATDMVAVVTAGENQTLQACYTVPLGYDALVNQFCIGNLSQAAAADEVTFRLRKSVAGAASRTTELMTLADSVQTCVRHDPPFKFSEKTDIELTATGGTSQATSGTFDIILVPNTM